MSRVKIEIKNRTINKYWLIISLLLGLNTIYQIFDQRDFIKNAEHTVGVVTEILVEEDSDGYNSYWPVVKFTAEDNKTYEFKSNVVNKNYFEGDDIPVIYLKSDVSSAIIWSDGAIWSRVYALIFLTSLSLLCGLGILKL
ncbi:DUF3592 domain-containing protein [Colwellia psychrerythraea]|uniref:DUF3592 domain-containing protein n=1 Tax=Colwellia psychrerythraea TaxID=28229 RepID=A0A099KSE7_COLPS|nr:DUF3592 domain-containing protein [Colwellia psychrerythraea]KGJ93466.1 Protein of unknown function DUF3592 [Colwellia psychrerythraea]